MSKIAIRLACLSSLVALASNARADLITWGGVQNATGPTEVSLNGTLVTAKNPWNTTSASPVVNGITFTAFAPTGWGNGGNLVLNGSTSGDAGYDTLMTTSRGTSEAVLTNPTGWGGIRIDNLGTLTLGKTYEIQVWFCDDRPGAGTSPSNTQINDRQMIFSSATGVATQTGGIVTNLGSLTQGTLSAAVEADPNNISGAGDTIFGQYVIGTFTRTSADQIWLLEQGVHPNATATLRPHVNAFQIRDVTPVDTPFTSLCAGDGSDATCPCTNPGLLGRGCDNTVGSGGAAITSTGIASVSADTLVLHSTFAVPFGPGLYYEGSATANPSTPFGLVFGNGLRCAGGATNRLEIQFADLNGAANSTVPLGAFGAAVASTTYYYQLWYRDTGNVGTCTPGAGFNFSNAISLTWAP